MQDVRVRFLFQPSKLSRASVTKRTADLVVCGIAVVLGFVFVLSVAFAFNAGVAACAGTQ